MKNTLTSSVKSIGQSAVEVMFTIHADYVSAIYDEICKEVQKEARIKGFRQGTVPCQVLKNKFPDLLKEKTIQKLIEHPFSRSNAKNTQNIPHPISKLELKDSLELKIGNEFTFTVIYDVFPSLNLPELHTITIHEHTVNISEEDIKQELERYRQQNAILEEKKTAVTEKNDVIIADFELLDKDGTSIKDSTYKNFTCTVGETNNPFLLKEELIGLKKGEKAIIPHPENDQTNITVTIKKIQNYILPKIDDELAQDISERYQNLADLKKDIKERLHQSAKDLLYDQNIQDILSAIQNSITSFEIPNIMIDDIFTLQFQNFLSQLSNAQNITPQQLQAAGISPERLREQWLPDIKKIAKNQIIIRTLLEDKKIQVTEQEITAFIKRQHPQENDISHIREIYEKNNAISNVKQKIMEEKLFDQLLKLVKKEKGTHFTYLTLRKFINQQAQKSKEKGGNVEKKHIKQ